MTVPTRISYLVLALALVLAGWLHLATSLLAILFSLVALDKLHLTKSKWLTVSLFVLIVLMLAYCAVLFTSAAWVALPRIADNAIPVMLTWAETHGVELPFTDYTSLKIAALQFVREQTQFLGHFISFARAATALLVSLTLGIVVAMGIFLNGRLDLNRDSHPVKNNLYSVTCAEISRRFRDFYASFATVMGAQILISTINTAITAAFLLVVGLPYFPVAVGITFLCGLLPVIGHLISNTVIVGIALTVSPGLAAGSLAFLVISHKLQYVPNNKMIGRRIGNPVWLTLLGLAVGGKLMGVPGIILAPVVLNYLLVETSRVQVKPLARE
jgi:predicted PurR-regulated permease PerM